MATILGTDEEGYEFKSFPLNKLFNVETSEDIELYEHIVLYPRT